jgi:hypothetical protein
LPKDIQLHPERPDYRLPTRIIDVGSPENRDTLKLCETTDPKTGKRAAGKYIAVSHRWGNPKQMFMTTSKNVDQLTTGFSFAILPRSFKDAVIVARMLGVQFIWIDSLCIKQDDDEEKEREFKNMEEVYASAYCTIAATSARDCDDGFLRRSADRCVRLSEESASVYVTTQDANFTQDVEHADLNDRGWVLQERALSHRIIHFAKGQTYWECGCGIGCETMDQIQR